MSGDRTSSPARFAYRSPDVGPARDEPRGESLAMVVLCMAATVFLATRRTSLFDVMLVALVTIAVAAVSRRTARP